MSKSPKPDQDSLEELNRSLARLSSRDQGELADRLVRLVALVAEEAAVRPSFARKLTKVLSESKVEPDGGNARRKQKRSLRRTPGLLDPFEVYKDGEAELCNRLGALNLEQLKDIIAEHGMNRDKLAMKWRTPGRLIDRIVDTVRTRASKGDVFRG